MGCAGSNPLPGDTMPGAANGRAASLHMADGEQPCTIMQKAMNTVNMDEMVKKIQDVTGSMENLMGETQEKLGSLFGKAEKKVEDTEQQIDDAINDSASTMPEENKIPMDVIVPEVVTDRDNTPTEEMNTDGGGAEVEGGEYVGKEVEENEQNVEKNEQNVEESERNVEEN